MSTSPLTETRTEIDLYRVLVDAYTEKTEQNRWHPSWLRWMRTRNTLQQRLRALEERARKLEKEQH